MTLAQQLIEREKELRTGYLDLGNCGLTELPDLSELEWLETLIVSNEWRDGKQRKWIESANTGAPNRLQVPPSKPLPQGLKKLAWGGKWDDKWPLSDFSFLEKLPHLQSLILSSNLITDWRFLEKLTKLQSLVLSSNQISDGRFLEKLTNLTSLDLSGNQISDLRFLKKLTSLVSLNLDGNRIGYVRFVENLTNLTSLNLSWNQISDIRSLENLANLTSLNLGWNRISDIRSLEKLTNLTSLDLNGNRISDIRFLEKLTNLHSLDLYDNQIKDLSFLEKLTNLNSLDLGGNQISDWNLLGRLTKLTSLGLNGNKIRNGYFLGRLTNLTSLDIGGTEINDWSFLENLRNLTLLDISYNSISNGRFFEKLTNLNELNLSSTEISDLHFLEKLSNLTSLDVSENEISELSFFAKLTNLTSLNLSFNKINSGFFLKHLTNLYSLDLAYNNFREIRFLENLTNLIELDLSHNVIKDSSFPKNLTNLIKLDLSHTSITDWSFLQKYKNLRSLSLSRNQIGKTNILKKITGHTVEKWIEKLGNLTSLDLSHNQITDGQFLKNLTNLTSLNLSNNKITDWSFLENLPNLTSLDLNSNEIFDGDFLSRYVNLTSLRLISNGIRSGEFLEKFSTFSKIDLSKNLLIDLFPMLAIIENNEFQVVWKEWYDVEEGEINLKDNPFENPPAEIVQKGNAAILEYFRQKEAAGAEPLLEAKLILLGDGRAGKTTLANGLLGKPAPTEADRTQGVDIIIGEYRFQVAGGGEFKLHIWDFAGQDKYKPLHQFFYTEGAVYVMVADSGNAGTDYDDWLQTAQLFGAGSPLLLALNEFREGIGYGAFDAEHWHKRFPALLKEVFLVNLHSKKGFEPLEQHIQKYAELLPHARMEYPKNWAAIRRELESRRDENFISLQEYLRVCRDNGLPEKQSALILSGVLHTIGVCLHYQKSELLRQYVILKNEWATEAVYRILEDPIVADEKKGFFDWDDLRRAWKDESYAEMRPQLLELMQQFKMAYPLPNGKEYVAPPLLPPAPPTGWEMPAGEELTLYIEYEFLPKALMTQFIVSRHTDIDRERTLVWRNGVVLRWPDALAQVEKTKSQGRDAFAVRVQGSGRKGLLTAILKTFRDLHEEYKGTKVSEIVPCPCAGCREGKNKQHYFDFRKLKNWWEKGVRERDCDESGEFVDLGRLLGDNFVFEKMVAGQPLVMGRAEAPIQKRTIRIFLASSAELKAEREQIELEINRMNKKLNDKGTFLHLSIWEDGQCVGKSFRSQDNYNEEVEACDVFALLFYSKLGKFTREEYELAIKRHAATGIPRMLTFKKDMYLPKTISEQEFLSLRQFEEELREAAHFPYPFETSDGLIRELKDAIEKLLEDPEF